MHGDPLHLTAFAFVDDVDIVQQLHTQDNTADTQRTLDIWEEGLWATGGLLVPDKSNWYAVRHQWINNSWRISKLEHCLGTLVMHSHLHNPQPVTQLDPSIATLALGVMFAPDGSMEPHTQYLLSKTKLWAEQIRSKVIPRHVAWYSLNAQIMKSIEYSLLATTMTRQQLDMVMAPILNTGLPHSGICRHMARASVYASVGHQGFGITHPYVTQGSRKLELFLEYSELPTYTSTLLQTSWSLCKRECGLDEDFLASKFSRTTSATTTTG
jgi:hypothetical protein